MARVVVAFVATLSLFRISLASLPFLRSPPSLSSKVTEFDWFGVKPSKELVYHECFGTFQCARLLVPLDWQAAEESCYNTAVALAIIKLPAKVAITDPTYGGAILTNPGGPGGSGVQLVQYSGPSLQAALDSVEAHFDLIGFDPRGVLLSGPDASCFADPLARDLWNIKTGEEGLLDGGNRVLSLQWARAKALGSLCASKETGKYMSTASVARDMLEIIERIEEHHHKALLAFPRQDQQNTIQAQSPLSGQNQGNNSGAMLQYLGFSYGTFLGATFASMYPDRVKRMILDGVVDAPDYVANGWATNLQDTDKVLQSFYRHCFDGGDRCPLYDSAGPKAIEKRLNDFLDTIRQTPIVAVDSSGSVPPEIITYSDIKSSIFVSLKSPVLAFQTLAWLLDQLYKREYDQVLRIIKLQTFVHCPTARNDSSQYPTGGNEATRAIVCVDGDDMSNQTRPEFAKYLELLESQSPAGGAIWASIRLTCTGWQTRPKWRYTGPFGSNTSAPILWIGNTADPVTPLRNAFNMAKGFPGSAVLQQDSEGHCALFNAPSSCTIEAIRQYLGSGALPKAGTVCPPERKPFDGQLAGQLEYDTDDEQERVACALRIYGSHTAREMPLGV